jgi:hypothetical protein
MSYLDKLYSILYKDAFKCSIQLSKLWADSLSSKSIESIYTNSMDPFRSFFSWAILHNSCTWNNIGLNLSWKFGYELDLSNVPAYKLTNPTYGYTLSSEGLKDYLNWMAIFPSTEGSSPNIKPSLLLKSPSSDIGLSMAKNFVNSSKKPILLLTN